MAKLSRYDQYAFDVVGEKILTCKWVKLACQRHIDDIAKQKTDGFHFYFDKNAADEVIEFIELLHHVEGKWANEGKLITLEPWQCFIVASLFGWKKTKDKTRRYRSAYIEVARKNAKTTLLAGIGLYLAFLDGEEGAQVYVAATKRDQAILTHGIATKMVRKDKSLTDCIKIFKNNLHNVQHGCKFEPLGKDADTIDGLNAHGAIIDEYHAHPDGALYDVLRSSMGARSQPMIAVITTAGFDTRGPCYHERNYVCNQLQKIVDMVDESYFGIIYTLDENDDWRDPAVWHKANPNLGVSVDVDDMTDMCAKAQESPMKQNDFKTKKCNIWTEARTVWIQSETWKHNNNCRLMDLTGSLCYGAYDLSTIADLTAWTLCFPPSETDGKYNFIHKFFIPELNMVERERRDKVPYKHWVDAGWICATPGNVVDYAFIEKQIRDDVLKYKITEIAYDPYNASDLTTRLQDTGVPLVIFQQGFRSISPAAKDFEKRALGHEMEHFGNPVMSWMVECTTIIQDPNGNIKPVKPDRNKASQRIDGVITSLMALDRAIRTPEQEDSVYEERGILML
jgi:phage terminase large subunit-like protein